MNDRLFPYFSDFYCLPYLSLKDIFMRKNNKSCRTVSFCSATRGTDPRRYLQTFNLYDRQ